MVPWLLSVWLFASSSLAQSMFTRGQKFQIILTGIPDTSRSPLPPTDAPIFDVDLFNTDAGTISDLKAIGKTVVCYFSAGSYENWRSDAKDFPSSDLGKTLEYWPDEKWIRTGSAKIRDIMSKRIKMASDKGCDAIDPDNTDGYQNDNGLNLQKSDLVNYMQFLQKTAASYNLKIGLKNSIDMLGDVGSVMDFAVNEQCANLSECSRYGTFLNSNKPVFHIEYPKDMNSISGNEKNLFCNGAGVAGMSTVIKNLALDGLVVFCDGSRVDTPTVSSGRGRPHTSSKPVTRSSTTRRSSSTPSSRRTSSSRPAVTSSTLITIPSTTEVPPGSTPDTSTPQQTPTSTPEQTPTSTPEQTPTSSSSSSSTRQSTTRRPTSTSRTSTQRPSSTSSNPGGGCKQKHWDQCGGQDWKGCTVCESPYQCKGVSPPYYYQCL